MSHRILVGSAADRLRDLPDRSVHAIVTSPPYWGLRDYGTGAWEGGDPECDHAPIGARASYAGENGESIYRGESLRGSSNRAHVLGAPHRGGNPGLCLCGAVRVDEQLGMEPEPHLYVERLVGILGEAMRVLRDDGTLWLNLGDTYASRWASVNDDGRRGWNGAPDRYRKGNPPAGYKPKDLMGIPWQVALALRDAGWYLRRDVIWRKPNPMPESADDRPTTAHEYVFLLSKRERYYYDADAIREPQSAASAARYAKGFRDRYADGAVDQDGYRGAVGGTEGMEFNPAGRNKRSVWDFDDPLDVWRWALRDADAAGTEAAYLLVREMFDRWAEQHDVCASDVWTIVTQPFREAHFAVFPPRLVEPMILAATPPNVCAECGAPVRRTVEQEGSTTTDEAIAAGVTDQATAYTSGARQNLAFKGSHWKLPGRARTTTGWERTCSHEDAELVPATVLDPFAGSGTSGVVCGWHGRDFVGIELNPEFAAMAERRIAREGRPSRRPVKLVEVAADQMGLFA